MIIKGNEDVGLLKQYMIGQLGRPIKSLEQIICSLVSGHLSAWTKYSQHRLLPDIIPCLNGDAKKFMNLLQADGMCC